mmetsp:Transcript_7198/g.19505  ORF Transcript_7198/g.19505 Transcript_7198/m.19505 type:complete len:303 (+) Transcript_7198:358-1266(+)
MLVRRILPDQRDELLGLLFDNPMHLSKCCANRNALICLPHNLHSQGVRSSFGGIRPQISVCDVAWRVERAGLLTSLLPAPLVGDPYLDFLGESPFLCRLLSSADGTSRSRSSAVGVPYGGRLRVGGIMTSVEYLARCSSMSATSTTLSFLRRCVVGPAAFAASCADLYKSGYMLLRETGSVNVDAAISPVLIRWCKLDTASQYTERINSSYTLRATRSVRRICVSCCSCCCCCCCYRRSVLEWLQREHQIAGMFVAVVAWIMRSKAACPDLTWNVGIVCAHLCLRFVDGTRIHGRLNSNFKF